ncbi:MAG TPA: hypothetical protein VGS79_08695 [Puia sp.]|nr:hypothetical protein [Puia sp.]
MTPITTRILAVGAVTSPLTDEDRKTIMPREVPATVELYLQGKIDQWWFRSDGKGVVFLLNMTNIEEAHNLLEALPLGVAKRMTFNLIPVGPLFPLGLLLNREPAASR